MTTTTPVIPQGPALARIRGHVPTLSRSGASVAAVILEDPRAVIHMTVSDLAVRSRTSVGSVVRFCQDLGFRGFHDLKLAIASDSPPAAGDARPDAEHSLAAVLHGVLTSSARAITGAESAISPDDFEAAATALAEARHVLVVGVGTSAPLAGDAVYRLRMIGVRAEALIDAHAQHVAATFCEPGDVCLAISHTGQTRETLETVETARSRGASTIAVTSFFRSPLTELCDIALVAGSAETRYRIEAMASRFAHLAVLDGLCAAIATLAPERARRAEERSSDVITAHRL